MAVTVDELLIKIELSGQKTSQELSKISDELENIKKSSDKTSKGVGGLSANFAKFGVAAFAAIQGAQGLVATLSSFASEFLQAEDAVKKLNIALQLSGSQQIPELIDRYKTLGDQLESFGVTSTETVLKLAKIGVAAGQTADQTEQLIKVAADLSVAREIPLEMAFKSLSTTLKGSAGSLAAIFPELQNFSAEQLKAGDAVKYLSLQLGGFAQTNLETYSGQLAVASTRLGDVKEELGRIVVGSVEASGAISRTTVTLEALADVLRTNSSFLQDIISGFLKVAEVLTSYVSAAFIGLFSIVVKGTSGFVSALGYMQRALSLVIPGTTQLGQSIIQMGKDLNQVGNDLQDFTLDIVKNGTMFPEAMQKNASSIDDLTKKTKEAQEAFKNLSYTMMTPEQRQAVDSLKNKVIELEKAQKTAGKTGVDLINAQAEASRLEINEIAKKIAGTGTLGAKYEKLVSQAKSFIELQRQAQITQLNEEQIQKVNDQYKALGDEIAKQTMTQREFIDYQLEKELELLEIKRQSAAFATGEAQDLLDATEKRLRSEAKGRKDKAPMEFGDYIKDIKDSFKSIEIPALSKEGISSFASQIGNAGVALGEGLAAGASAIGSYLMIAIDVIKQAPGFLKSAFLELPLIILDALTQLPAIIDEIIAKFPDIIAKIADNIGPLLLQIAMKIDDLMIMLLEQLPILIEKIAEALPEIIITLIKNIPRMLGAILKAIINSVLGFIRGLGRGIMGLLTGKGIKLDKIVDTKGIEDKIKKLTGETGRVFSVENLMEAAQDPVKAIYDVVEGASKKAADYLKQAWQWVMDKIIQPIFDGLKAVWMFIYDKVIMPIYNFVRNAWLWVLDNVLRPIYNIVRDAWLWVYNNIIAPIANVISSAWQWVIDNVINPLMTIGQKIAEPIQKIIDNLLSAFSSVFNAVTSILQPILDALKSIRIPDWLKDLKLQTPDWFDRLKIKTPEWFDKLKIQTPEWLDKLKIGGGGGGGGGISIPPVSEWFASGGPVYAQNGLFVPRGTDTVPAMLTPGEFVMSRRGVEANGLGILSAMNRGQAPSTGDTYVQIEINVDAKTTMDEGYIRGTLIPKMSEELRRASLDGKFVLSSRGIR